MAAKSKTTGSFKTKTYSPGPPKKSRQGAGAGTKHSATSRNVACKKYRGQGR